MAGPPWKLPLATLGSVMVFIFSVNVAFGDVAFRKKPAAPASEGTGEISGSGETTGKPATEEEPAKPAEPPRLQAEDRDNPKAIPMFGEQPEATAATKPGPEKPAGPKPYYETWQFWAIAGGSAVAAGLIIWGAYALLKPQVADCNLSTFVRCDGAGR